MTSVLLERPAAGRIPSRRVRKLMRALAREEVAHRNRFARTLHLRFRELGDQAAAAYERRRSLKAAQPEPPTGDDLLTVTEVMTLLNVAGWRDRVLRAELERHYLRVALATGETLEGVLGLGVMLPDPVQRVILDTGGRRAGLIDVDGQTREALYRALADGREAGEGPAKLAERIRGYVPAGRFGQAGAGYRARLIARTETKYAQNVSTLAAYQQSPAVGGVICYDNRTGYGDEDCTARDGEVMSFDDAQQAADEEHPNGTLSFGPATGG